MTYENQPFGIWVHLGPISYWICDVMGLAAETSAKISFAILACASRFTGVTACVYKQKK